MTRLLRPLSPSELARSLRLHDECYLAIECFSVRWKEVASRFLVADGVFKQTRQGQVLRNVNFKSPDERLREIPS